MELEQYNIDEDGLGDLDRAMIDASNEFSLGGAIPSPHVTALYGIDAIENELDDLDNRLDTAENFRMEIRTDLAEIKNDLIWIRRELQQDKN